MNYSSLKSARVLSEKEMQIFRGGKCRNGCRRSCVESCSDSCKSGSKVSVLEEAFN